ncbi:energy transducer TonB [Lysobacter sp. CA199]|uniref:energy transducer TonB n=1 Tax=Lysobacter sp. CA199 TaxID=3455608 RepID=UPI003F8D19CB
MDLTAGPNTRWSAVRIAAMSGAVSLHAALLLALTLPVVASIQHGDEFFVPYDEHWCYYECQLLSELESPYYHYAADGVTVRSVTAVPLETENSTALPEIAASADRLTAPVDPYTRTFDERARTVELQILVSATGAVLAVDVLRSSGDSDLDRQARTNAWERWRFKPAFDGGRAVPSSVIVAIEFDFRGKSEKELRHEPWRRVVI